MIAPGDDLRCDLRKLVKATPGRSLGVAGRPRCSMMNFGGGFFGAGHSPLEGQDLDNSTHAGTEPSYPYPKETPEIPKG
jgi:hypothetical protein